jgi:hypothetical protein
MRKQRLLGSTAVIVGASAAPDIISTEEPHHLDGRGIENDAFIPSLGAGDSGVDGMDVYAAGEFACGEIQIRSGTVLDTGLTVGIRVDLETDTGGDRCEEGGIVAEGALEKTVAN